MTNFFNKKDLIIVVDDDICPNDKEKFKFTDLPENIIKSVANYLELVEDEYEELTLSYINGKLNSSGKKIDDFIKYDIPDEFKSAKLVLKYHPSDVTEGTITNKVKESGANRNFIVLDKFLEKNRDFNLLKQYLSELCEIISEFYIGIVFYSSDPNLINSLKQAEEFLKDVGLSEEEIGKLSMHVNFVDKKAENKLMFFETAFRKSQNNNLISLYSESYSKTIQELKEKIWDINNNEDLIHYDYLMEGMQLDEIIYEIYQSRFNKIYSKKCFENYEKYINPVRKATQTYEENKGFAAEKIKNKIFISRSLKEINNLLKQETYISNCKKSDDIKFGDILKLNDLYYMIVTQDCDLSIRLLGGRKSNFITLIRINYSCKNITNELIANKFKNIYKQTFRETTSKFNKDIIKSCIEPFKKLGINERSIDNIFDKTQKDNYEIECESTSIKLSDDIKLYHIESIFLDGIILNNESSDKIELTRDNIKKSKEIRMATKRYIMENFEELINKFSKLKYESLKEISDGHLISDLLPIEFIFDEKNNLIGLSVNKDKFDRVGHLDYVKAYDIFREFMNKYSRFSYYNTPLI